MLERNGRFDVTDFGQALGWLRMQAGRGQLSTKQKRMVEDVCLTLGFEVFRGQLIRRATGAEFLTAILRVAQAALRIPDIWFTMRTRAVEAMADEVADWLTEKQIPYERSPRYTGRSGRTWTVDYHTRLPQRSCLVLLLATGSRAAAHRVLEQVVAGLYDLSHLRVGQPNLRFVSLFDDTEDVWGRRVFALLRICRR